MSKNSASPPSLVNLRTSVRDLDLALHDRSWEFYKPVNDLDRQTVALCLRLSLPIEWAVRCYHCAVGGAAVACKEKAPANARAVKLCCNQAATRRAQSLRTAVP